MTGTGIIKLKSSHRSGLAGLFFGFCTACSPGPSVPASAVPSVPLRIAVADKQIIIAGPQDYCIDKAAARDSAAGSFVLLGSCAAIAGTAAAGQPVAPAILTASVSPGGGPLIGQQLEALNGYFRSKPGLAALSRSGQASAISLQRAWGSDGVFYLAAHDRSTGRRNNVQAEFWRAVFDLRGRIITLNVTGLKSRPLSEAAGRATLEAFVRQVQRENRKTTGL